MNVVNAIMCVILFSLGLVIRKGDANWLVSGYNLKPQKEQHKYDQKAQAKAVSNILLILSGITFMMFIIMLLDVFDSATVMIAGWVTFNVVALGGIVFMNIGNRYRRTDLPPEEEEEKQEKRR